MARTGRARRLNGYFHVGALSVSSITAVGDFNGAAASFAGTGRERISGTGSFTTSKATFSAYGKITGTGAFTAAKATFSGFANIGAVPHLTIDEQGPRTVQFPLPRTAWTVNGTPVSMYETSWSSAWDGGYDQMRGRLTQADMERANIVQGSLVHGYTSDGSVIFEGRVSTPPEVADGMAAIGAQGIRVKAEHKVDRLFIQSRDMDIWATTDSDPHLGSAGGAIYGDSDKMDVNLQGGISWRLDRDVVVANDRENGAICYLEGVAIKRVTWAGRWEDADNRGALAIRLNRADGPTGPQTFLIAFTCNAGNRNEVQDVTLASAADQVMLMLYTNSDITPSENLRYQAQKIRVNSSIETGDTFTGSQIASYIGDTLNWDTSGVSATTENALPFDWNEGSWADALTYVAETDDRYWRVVAGDKLEYADWGDTTWTAYLSRGTNADLTPEEVFNQVWVWYDTPKGIRRRAVINPDDIGEDDPLGGGVNIYEYELNDRQSDAAFANRVGERLLRRVIQPRHSGTLACTMLFDSSGASRPYAALAGDVVRIADWGPNESLSLRILSTDADAAGVRLGVERPFSLGHLLTQRHRKRRHKGGKGKNA